MVQLEGNQRPLPHIARGTSRVNRRRMATSTNTPCPPTLLPSSASGNTDCRNTDRPEQAISSPRRAHALSPQSEWAHSDTRQPLGTPLPALGVLGGVPSIRRVGSVSSTWCVGACLARSTSSTLPSTPRVPPPPPRTRTRTTFSHLHHTDTVRNLARPGNATHRAPRALVQLRLWPLPHASNPHSSHHSSPLPSSPTPRGWRRSI